MERISLEKTIQQAIKKVRVRAREKKIKIEFTPGNKDHWVMADPTVLTDIWVILLDNALRYSAAETMVKIDLGSSLRHFVVKVCDQGKGIAKHHLPHIFERFYRVDSSRSATDGGFGLGLSLAQKIIYEHHGSVQVSSVLDEGTCFTVKLPKILKEFSN